MFDKAKLALTLATPSMQRKIGLLSGWFEGLMKAVNDAGVEVNTEVKGQEDVQTVIVELLKKAKIKRIDEKNALFIELDGEDSVRLIMSYKVVEHERGSE